MEDIKHPFYNNTDLLDLKSELDKLNETSKQENSNIQVTKIREQYIKNLIHPKLKVRLDGLASLLLTHDLKNETDEITLKQSKNVLKQYKELLTYHESIIEKGETHFYFIEHLANYKSLIN